LDARKGGDLALRAFIKIAESYPKATLTFVGPEDRLKSGNGTFLFQDFCRQNVPEQIGRRIRFVGLLARFDVMSLRRTHSITIIASRYENGPYSVLEAMSLGCPIIATAVGGIPELIKDGRNGLLAPSEDVEAISDACLTLLNDHPLAVRLGRQARLDCRDFYSPETIAEQTVSAYREAIDSFNSRIKSAHQL
jgi:glycosyltransferase involved in cell wall biosynthesis